MNRLIIAAIIATLLVIPATVLLTVEKTDCYEYSWDYEGKSYVLDMKKDPQLLSDYRDKTNGRIPLGTYEIKAELFSQFVTESITEQYLIELVNDLKTIYGEKSDFDLFIRSFIILNFDYSYDYVNYGFFDWVAYPLETMENGSGDCEDLGIFLLSLLIVAGYDCGFVLFSDHFLPIVSAESTVYSEVDGFTQFELEYNGNKYMAFETAFGSSCPAGYTDCRYSSEDIRTVRIL